jgi:hypothetical protein
MITGLREGKRRRAAEGNVAQVDLLGDAVRRRKAGDRALETLRVIKPQIAASLGEGDGAGDGAARQLERSSSDRGIVRGPAGQDVLDTAAVDPGAGRGPAGQDFLDATTTRSRSAITSAWFIRSKRPSSRQAANQR